LSLIGFESINLQKSASFSDQIFLKRDILATILNFSLRRKRFHLLDSA